MKNSKIIVATIALVTCVVWVVQGQEPTSSSGSSTASQNRATKKKQLIRFPTKSASVTPAGGSPMKAGAQSPREASSPPVDSPALQAAPAKTDFKVQPASDTAVSGPGSANPSRGRITRTPGVPAEDLSREFPPVIPETLNADARGLPVGPQNPSLNISWIGPVGVNVGEETSCQIAIRNMGQTLARDVVVHATVPAGVRFVSSDPEPSENGKTVAWTLGQVEPRTERLITLRIVPEDKGTVTAMASVTFSSMTCANIRIEEPKLDLQINVPAEVILGDALTFVLMVTNPGSSPTAGVTIATTLPDGLKNPNGKEIEFEVGNLEPEESRAVQVSVTAVKPGEQRIRAIASAGAKLKSPAEAMVQVIQPELTLKSTGPALRYLDREATYTLTTMNPGTATTNNVRLVATIPAGFQFVKAGDGGKHDWTGRTVSWFVGQLQPGESRDVQLSLMASELGKQTLHASAIAERDLKAFAETITQIDGIAALLLEVVDVDDPVEVGRETAYEIRVTNQGSKEATNIQIVVDVPDEMQVLEAKGPVAFEIQGQKVVFEPLAKLTSKADTRFRVKVKGLLEGDLRFRARMTSDVLRSPVVEEESTKIYKD